MAGIGWSWQVDGWMILAGMLSAIASTLVGNFLVLRQMSLMGDAISHAVLPGIAAAFIVSGTRSSVPVLIGATAMGLVTVWLIELVRRYGNVEESAAIGVVFTALFALGVLLISRAGEHVDLDPSCILYGNLETIILDTVDTPLGEIPTVIIELGCICLFNVIVVVLLFKQWRITTFDPALAQSQGISVTAFHYLLAAMVAVTCIASFRAVGNILVVAMLIVPAAAAYLMCLRLNRMILVSVIIAAAAAFLGHVLAVAGPRLVGYRSANSAAMIAVLCGAILVVAIVVSPRSGLIVRWSQRRRVARRILADDIIALIYRELEKRKSTHESSTNSFGLKLDNIAERLKITAARVRSVANELLHRGELVVQDGLWCLTATGQKSAQNIVRSHRLWEQYLSVEAGVSDPRLHVQAESLEHYTDRSMRGELDKKTGSSAIDPHGKSIPPEG